MCYLLAQDLTSAQVVVATTSKLRSSPKVGIYVQSGNAST